jgi:hypothetical protein
MTKRYDDDDDIFETTASGKRILRDGARVRVSLTDAQTARLHDGRGGEPGHRPGFAISDAVVHDERQRAYEEYDQQLGDAWRKDAAPFGAYPLSAGEGSECTINGAPGTLVREGNCLVCKPSNRQDAAHTVDARDLAYAEYDKSTSEAWRGAAQ